MKIKRTKRSQIGFVQDFDTCGHGVPSFPVKVNRTVAYGLRSVRDDTVRAFYDSKRRIATLTVRDRLYYGKPIDQTTIVENVSFRQFDNFVSAARNLQTIKVV